MALRVLLLLVFLVTAAFGQNFHNTLPGYNGQLPFELESGYVSVGDNDEVKLFYLFAESQSNADEDPILLWLTGGPGCSSLRAFFFENGPLTFNFADYKYDGSLPELILNNYTWTKGLSIIYLDGPAGTGYSYSTTAEGYQNDDSTFTSQMYQFLQKWLLVHNKFIGNQLYLGGDGYSGNQVPILATLILNRNEEGYKPHVNLTGYVLGNPGADRTIDVNGAMNFANRLALVSDEDYEAAYTACDGNFVNPPSTLCQSLVNYINTELLGNINSVMVLEPACKDVPNYLQMTHAENMNSARRSLEENSESDASSTSCRKYNHELCAIWANDEAVQEELGVQTLDGKLAAWKSCNDSIIVGTAYEPKATSVVAYYKNLTKTNLRGLIYSGDHDMEVSYVGTQKWIWSLEMNLSQIWTPWSVNNETAGYMRKFTQGDFNLTFATVKGAGHFAAEYKVEECSEMIKRWMTNDTVIGPA